MMKKLTSRKKPEWRTLSVRLPRDLYESLEAFHQELRAFDESMVLDVNALVIAALRRDLRVAREELAQLKQVALEPPPVRQSTVGSASGGDSAPVTAPPRQQPR